MLGAGRRSGTAAKPPAFRRLLRLSLLCGLVYLGLIAMFAGLQRKLIYIPLKGKVDAAAAGIPIERVSTVTIPTEDGILLHGWLTRPDPVRPGPVRPDPVPPESSEEVRINRPFIILFPGNAGHRAARAAIIHQFNSLGCDVLACDYRGYAENEGVPSEEAIAADARAIWNYARNELDVPPERIILYGQSLGGGVATRLAWDLKQEGHTPGGLVLKATFTSLVDAGRFNYPWLPVRWLLVDRYPSIERIPDLTCPILVIHGRRDLVVPFEQGRLLFETAPPRSLCGIDKEFLGLPHAGHNDILTVANGELLSAHGRFLERLSDRNRRSILLPAE